MAATRAVTILLSCVLCVPHSLALSLHTQSSQRQYIGHKRSRGSNAWKEAGLGVQGPVDGSVEALQAAPAGIQAVARQALFDYGAQVSLSFLCKRVTKLAVPDATKIFNIPIVGSFQLDVSSITINSFAVDQQSAQLEIREGFFHLLVSNISTHISFSWRWQKAGLSGQGDGDLTLSGGTVDYIFVVEKDVGTDKPQFKAVTVNVNFDNVELHIHARAADWLYQAVLTLFNELIKRRVVSGVQGVLANDVPERLNTLLQGLPSQLDVPGLPFSVSFDYTIYTLTYVLVKGYGQVELDTRDNAPAGTNAGSRTAVQQASRCPFDASPLPIPRPVLAEDSHMLSIFVHESTLNCLLWAAHQTGKLSYVLQEGSVKDLHVTTDLMANLIPDLPKTYPHQYLRIEVQTLAPPQVSFSAEEGVSVAAQYRTTVYIANITLGDPKIATLAANLTATGTVGWDEITITAAQASHVVEWSALPVPTDAWDMTIAWFVQNYGSTASLSQVVDALVKAPPALALTNTQGGTAVDRWYELSTDLDVYLDARRRRRQQ